MRDMLFSINMKLISMAKLEFKKNNKHGLSMAKLDLRKKSMARLDFSKK